jgi:hypothetical protein
MTREMLIRRKEQLQMQVAELQGRIDGLAEAEQLLFGNGESTAPVVAAKPRRGRPRKQLNLIDAITTAQNDSAEREH